MMQRVLTSLPEHAQGWLYVVRKIAVGCMGARGDKEREMGADLRREDRREEEKGEKLSAGLFSWRQVYVGILVCGTGTSAGPFI
jgi:hypothetical protein